MDILREISGREKFKTTVYRDTCPNEKVISYILNKHRIAPIKWLLHYKASTNNKIG